MRTNKTYLCEVIETGETITTTNLWDAHRLTRRKCRADEVPTYRVVDYSTGMEGTEVIYEKHGGHWDCINRGDWLYDRSLEYIDKMSIYNK